MISTDRRALAKLLAAAIVTGVAGVAGTTQASAEAKPKKGTNKWGAKAKQR